MNFTKEDNSDSMGQGSFIWFIGVVEDVKDPKKLGRVKVRVFGDHTQIKKKIKTEALPWALMMGSSTSASINGIGSAPVGLVQGSHVIGFYLDGVNKQTPMIIGTTGGHANNSPNPSVGFNDPDGKFPMASLKNEPDTNRLARGGDDHEAYTTRKQEVIKGSPTATTQWDEPTPVNTSAYPFNSVTEYYYDDGLWGHIEEWDSTPGKERYLKWFKSKSFTESYTDGSEVHKIVGDNFELDLRSKHLLVKKNYNVSIEGNRDEHVGGKVDINVDGDVNWTIGGTCNMDIGGDWNVSVGGGTNILTKGSYLNKAGGTIDLVSAGNMGQQAPNINADTGVLAVTGIVDVSFCECKSRTAIKADIDRT